MAVVLGAFVPDTAARWRSAAKREAARELRVAAEARKLAARLEKVGAALCDAEARAARGDEDAARWLAKVRAATYEADGALDRLKVVARRHGAREPQQQLKHQALPWLLSSCCDTAELRSGVAAGLKSLSQMLRTILKEQRRLQLHASVADYTVHARSAPRLQASQPEIIGVNIQEDARRLIHRLTQTDTKAACEVVAIVGPDGIGKTALAKAVCQSARARCCFQTIAWVRLSRGYTEAGLLTQVIDAVGGDTTGAGSVSKLQATLAGLVANRRFLLLIDDVCRGAVWEDVLRSPLERGGSGSKVLVTARHGSIAREMDASHVHRVKKLGADDGWMLLRAAACVATDELKAVGEKIVDKCRGVPLAIKAVAGVLRTRKPSAGEWEEVLASPAWSVKGLPDDAMKPLYLCYDDLPCHLKQCFLYCSLFPPDFAVDRRTLVLQWIAEGFVQIRHDAGLEEVAQEYYDELVGRNLLQPADAEAHSCTMHDTLRALAQLLSQGEDFTGDPERPLRDGDGDPSVLPRRVSLPSRNLDAVPERILKLEGVTTLLLPKNPLTTEGSIFTRMRHLKNLDLSETRIEIIPETLGNLVYLRFLNLSQTSIHALPESIGNLGSLKFLLLRQCKSLHTLPKGMEHLRGLRELDLAGTEIEDAAFRVGKLRSLTSLQCFNVTSKEAEDRSGWPLNELKHLTQLKTLHVQRLEKAVGRSEAIEAALAGKTVLRELELSCNGTVGTLQSATVARTMEDIFEELTPPQCLESLKIANYSGTKFPGWLSAVFLPNLGRLDIIGCNFCESLPPLGRLPELRSLYIADCSALKDINAEFLGKDHHHQVLFPKLESLHLQGLHRLSTWMDIEAGALPALQALQIESCPELRCLPGSLRHLKSLTELWIVDMANLEDVEDIAALRELSVWNAPNLKKISNMPSLVDLNTCHCPVLQIVENVDRLRAVHIFDYELREMPRWIETLATKLRSLEVTSTVKLLKRCLHDGPDWHLIKDIAQVHWLTTGSSYMYYSKSPYIFESNVNTQENLVFEGKKSDSENTDNVPVESRKANQSVPVSPSETDYLEISGFFDSKVVKTGTARTEDNVVRKSPERSMPRRSQRRMHKLAEVVPEDSDVEEGTLSEAIPHKSRGITNDETGHDAIASSVFTRGRPKMGKDVPTDAGTAADTSVSRSAAALGHTLVREGSQAINTTKTDQNLNFSILGSKECTLDKEHNTADKVPATVSVEKSVTQMVKNISAQVVSRESKDIGRDRTENASPATFARSRKVTFREDTNADATIPSSNTGNQKHAAERNEIALSATAGTNATPMPRNQSDKEVTKKYTDVSSSSLICEGPRTVSVTETTEDASLLHCEQRFSNEGKKAPDAAIGTTYTADDQMGNNISLNHEGSEAVSVHETASDSEPSKLPASLAFNKPRALKKQEDDLADPGDGTDSVQKIIGMEVSEKVGCKCKVGPMKDPAAEIAKSTTYPLSKPMRAMSLPTNATETTTKAEVTMANRFSTNGRTGESHEAPKVYTAVWADTDTDTLRARFLSSMQHYRRMASRRRRRHRKHNSEKRWSIGPVLLSVLLFVSLVQLLFIIWLYRRLLNQK